jgi:hypothetical protein
MHTLRAHRLERTKVPAEPCSAGTENVALSQDVTTPIGSTGVVPSKSFT